MAEDTQPARPAQTTGSGQGAASPAPVQAVPAVTATPAVAVRPSADVVAQAAEQIQASANVLVALSKDPNVDELAAAIGLTFLLDKMGKHATAIFSGAMPNAIEFLEPEKTFEANTNSLQDFIIALDKEKADHLRYKIEGDYVKVFITPYKTTIDEKDLEFSHGELNVDLVVSLDVADVADLDKALESHGRILHDASGVNITIGVPGKFGDVEWSDPGASSVSEMVGVLAQKLQGQEILLDKPIATALLAGIVAATSRFSNERTTPATMALASALMAAGADQQLISASIPVAMVDAEVAPEEGKELAKVATEDKEAPDDATKLRVEHNDEVEKPVAEQAEAKAAEPVEAPDPVEAPKSEVSQELLLKPTVGAGLTDEEKLEKSMQALSGAGATPEKAAAPIMDELREAAGEKVLAPIDDGVTGVDGGEQPDYAAMIEQELKTPLPVELEKQVPEVPSAPAVAVPPSEPLPMPNSNAVTLPPPPPPFDPSVAPVTPAAPTVVAPAPVEVPVVPTTETPVAAPAPIAAGKPADPSAFKLPGM